MYLFVINHHQPIAESDYFIVQDAKCSSVLRSCLHLLIGRFGRQFDSQQFASLPYLYFGMRSRYDAVLTGLHRHTSSHFLLLWWKLIWVMNTVFFSSYPPFEYECLNSYCCVQGKNCPCLTLLSVNVPNKNIITCAHNVHIAAICQSIIPQAFDL